MGNERCPVYGVTEYSFFLSIDSRRLWHRCGCVGMNEIPVKGIGQLPETAMHAEMNEDTPASRSPGFPSIALPQQISASWMAGSMLLRCHYSA